MTRLVCIRCGKEGHRSSQCKWPVDEVACLHSFITDQEWSNLCAQVKQWEKLARDQDEQTPPGDGGQRLPRRKICPLCDLPPDSQCQFANCKRRWAE